MSILYLFLFYKISYKEIIVTISVNFFVDYHKFFSLYRSYIKFLSGDPQIGVR